jgi:OmcA/MtrC family decaheme c-type cytochrome
MALVHARRGGLLALLAVTAAACGEPQVGGKVVPPPSPTGYQLAITGASLDATRHVVVAFSLSQDGAPVALADLPALLPSFTLAGLLPDPVSNLPTWQSYLLVGSGTLASLPLGGPGTPAGQILQNQKQPGAVTATAADLAEVGAGQFRVTVGTPLPVGLDPARTMRIGAWLGGVPGTADTSTTFDWVPAGGTPVQRQTVLDSSCSVCHGRLTAHEGHRSGVKLCLTCHTIQNADPDTQDPAAPVRALTVVPEVRTVVAGTAASSFTATLLASTAAVTWTLSPDVGAGSLSTVTAATTSAGSTSTVRYTPPAADPAVVDPIPVTLTASLTVQGAATGGYTPPPVTLGAPVAITVVQPPAAPAVAVNPAAQGVVMNGPAVPLSAVLLGVTGTPAWTISPATGAGTLSASSGATVNYTPPVMVAGPTTVTVTATAGGASGVTTLTVIQAPAGSASRLSDPNPLDLGRLVHRIHRGKNLPTLYLASSIAPAPLLPPAGPAPAALPLPFLTGRNAMAVGSRFSLIGPRGVELVAGRVATRIENGQPPKVVAEGITFPRDLRDCDACHRGAPQRGEMVTAISRRTCQSCHPDVWFGAGPITDLVHFSHTGGPQADDSKCAGCHVSGPGVLVPLAEAHVPPLLSPYYDQPTVEVTGVSDFQPGRKPTVTFRITDRVGVLGSLSAPQPATETGPSASPVPRALARVSITVAGPTADYRTGNSPFSQLVPLATTVADPVTGDFSYTFTTALPDGAAGTWGLGMEVRRLGTLPLYDQATQSFRWPFTGESITEYADNPVVYVDTAMGSWPGGAPAPRRNPIERNNCRACHLEITFHGNLRHNPSYCVLCHTADATDWSRRPKGPDGNVNLSTVYSDTKIGTYDNLEERSIHFKVMIHRIHTGEGQGTARIEVGAPHVIAGLFLDDIKFPGRLADCTLCHEGTTWLLEGQPADAAPTTANETSTLTHAATVTHGAAEAILPITATCVSCHGTAFAYDHSARYTKDGVEQCAQCHTRGAVGVPAAHGLPTP